ncbi:MAG: BatD family protein [Flavisolibacter sp.]
MKCTFLYWIILFFIPYQLLAQTISITATADKNAILIGEPVELTIEATVPKNKVIPFHLPDSLMHFDIISKSGIDSQITDKGLHLKQVIKLTSWDSGKWSIPSFSFGKYRSAAITITVSFSNFDPNQPYHDIKDNIEVQKAPESNWWWYVAGILFLLALFYLFFPQGKKKPVEENHEADSAFKEAIKNLRKLKSDNEIDPKLFYTRLIDIFRTYIQKKKNIQSFSKTTEDISMQIKELKIPKEQYEKLVETLQVSDMVKFARLQPSETDIKRSAEVIENSIEEIEQAK